jgi:hypothetical protein
MLIERVAFVPDVCRIIPGGIAAYYPEANVLVALDHCDLKSGTPSYKSTPVLLSASSSTRWLVDCSRRSASKAEGNDEVGEVTGASAAREGFAGRAMRCAWNGAF